MQPVGWSTATYAWTKGFRRTSVVMFVRLRLRVSVSCNHTMLLTLRMLTSVCDMLAFGVTVSSSISVSRVGFVAKEHGPVVGWIRMG